MWIAPAIGAFIISDRNLGVCCHGRAMRGEPWGRGSSTGWCQSTFVFSRSCDVGRLCIMR